MSTSIEEVAKRVLQQIVAAREGARSAGYAQADEIGADAERLARYVLDRPALDVRVLAPLTEAVGQAGRALLALGVPATALAAVVRTMDDEPRPCAECGGSGEVNAEDYTGDMVACGSCDGQTAPAADPRQFTMPGVEPPAERPAPVEAKPAAPPARQRAEEPEIAIEDWKPEPMWISSLQTALEDTAAVEAHLARFRVEKTGQKTRRWPSVFRSWLARAREQPGQVAQGAADA